MRPTPGRRTSSDALPSTSAGASAAATANKLTCPQSQHVQKRQTFIHLGSRSGEFIASCITFLVDATRYLQTSAGARGLAVTFQKRCFDNLVQI